MNNMEEEATFQTYGFDTFIGKSIEANGETYVVNLCLNSKGGRSVYPVSGYKPLRYSINWLCWAVKEGEKVLLRRYSF